MRFRDIHDKGKSGALLSVNFFVYQNIKGKRIKVGQMTSTIMVKGVGGFGYKGKYPSIKVSKIPETKPDLIVEEPTFPQ